MRPSYIDRVLEETSPTIDSIMIDCPSGSISGGMRVHGRVCFVRASVIMDSTTFDLELPDEYSEAAHDRTPFGRHKWYAILSTDGSYLNASDDDAISAWVGAIVARRRTLVLET